MEKILSLYFEGANKLEGQIPLSSSKSESNRALIIHALTGFLSDIQNLSDARDTQTMLRLLSSNEETLDVIDAGTTMRFLTAYFSITNQTKILTGTARMCERPIGLLVDALRKLGAKIDYVGKEGYPPLAINGFSYSGTNYIKIKGDVSSQYVSALLMVGSSLPDGLILELEGTIASRPYIQMTLDLMKSFGVNHIWEGQTITIKAQKYTPSVYEVESDWSGASYWYSFVSLAHEAEVTLLGLKKNSLQGDSAIVKIMENFGVKTTFVDKGVVLTKILDIGTEIIDFSDCPDLAQTVAVVAGIKKMNVNFTGIESLKIKETDRIKAIQSELGKFGVSFEETSKGVYKLDPYSLQLSYEVEIETYDDHRMAMAFAPIVTRTKKIRIINPDVVQKSYPLFWNHCNQLGIQTHI